MNMYKKIAAAALMLLAFALPSAAQFQRGEKNVGAKIGYVSKNESASLGLVFQYSFTSHLRIAPEIGCVFKHQGLDALTLDLNLHSPFAFSSDRVALYPLAGLNFSSWNYSIPDSNLAEDYDVSTRYSRLGLNLGAGFELRCTRTLKLGVEAKYTLIKRFSGAYVSALIAYTF